MAGLGTFTQVLWISSLLYSKYIFFLFDLFFLSSLFKSKKTNLLVHW